MDVMGDGRLEKMATPEKRSLLRTFSIFRPFANSSSSELSKNDGKSEVVSVSNVLHR